MKVTIDGIEYEGTPDEIREIVVNPPTRSSTTTSPGYKWPYTQEWPWQYTQPMPDYPGINWPDNPYQPQHYPLYPTSPVTATWTCYEC